jgi:hypothetical protein
MISMPGRRRLATSSAAATMYERSGSFVLRNGVGTQMLTVSSSWSTSKSVLADSRPAACSSATVLVGTSSMYDAPLLIVRTFAASRSSPIVW